MTTATPSNAVKRVKIVKLSQFRELCVREWGDEYDIRVACEPDDVVDARLAPLDDKGNNKADELWCFYPVDRDGVTVGEIGRFDQKFFAIWFVLHRIYKVWQPYLEQEPALQPNLAGRKEAGKILIPVTRLGGAQGVDMVLVTTTTDPLGRKHLSLAAASKSNPAKVGEHPSDKLVGYGATDVHRVNATGVVGYYVRWLEPSQLKPEEMNSLMPVGAFVALCEDARVRSALLGVFQLGALRPEFQPKSP